LTPEAEGAAFAYSRALAPPLWAFAFIMAVELLVVHLLVSALWSHVAALILSALSLAALIWTIAFIRSLRRLPVLVDGEGVTMRLGSLRSVTVPAAYIAGLRTAWPRERLKERGVLNLAMINYPNVMLDLDPPLTVRRRALVAITHRLDDPAGFAAAVGRLTEART
jgi:hypothetical protein